jgi:hypothetical protein
MTRAANAAERLDRYMDSLKGSGTLKQFTHTYRPWRKAAARGEGFMPFSVAELRFKRALIPLLMNGGKPPIGTSFFSAIFDTK